MILILFLSALFRRQRQNLSKASPDPRALYGRHQEQKEKEEVDEEEVDEEEEEEEETYSTLRRGQGLGLRYHRLQQFSRLPPVPERSVTACPEITTVPERSFTACPENTTVPEFLIFSRPGQNKRLLYKHHCH